MLYQSAWYVNVLYQIIRHLRTQDLDIKKKQFCRIPVTKLNADIVEITLSEQEFYNCEHKMENV